MKTIVGFLVGTLIVFSPLSFADHKMQCGPGVKQAQIHLKTPAGKTVKAWVKCNDLNDLRKGAKVEFTNYLLEQMMM